MQGLCSIFFTIMSYSRVKTPSVARLEEVGDAEEAAAGEMASPEKQPITDSHLTSYITEKIGRKPIVPLKSKNLAPRY